MISSENAPKWHAVQYGPYWNIQDEPFYDCHKNVLDEQDYPETAKHHAKTMAAMPQIVCCLLDYIRAQSNMLTKYSEGDEAVKKQLWQELHTCEIPARELLESLDILPFGHKSFFSKLLSEIKIMP